MRNEKKLLSKMFVYFTLFALMTFSAFAATATPVNLGTAEHFAVLSKVQIDSTGSTTIVGDIGVSPAAHTFITGFSLIGVPATDTFLTSAQVTGKAYAANLVPPTPSEMTTSISDMELAYAAATTGQTAGVGPFLNIGAGTIIAQTLNPGVYTWGTSIVITDDLTLNCLGNTKALFVFQIAGNLQIDAAKKIILSGGCQNNNVFWAVAGTTNLLAGSTIEGTVLGGPASSEITIITGSVVNGRLLGEKTIALQAGTFVTKPVDATDNTQPSITLNTPNNTFTSNNQTSLNFTFIDAVSATASCNLFIDGVLRNTSLTASNNTLTSITPNISLTNGAHTWFVNCTDLSVNEGTSASRIININTDTQIPFVSVVSPINNTWSASATPSFTFNYIDNSSATASCTLFANGVARGTNSAVVNNTNTAITSNASLSQGSSAWFVNCTDQAGNVGSSSTRTVLVDSVLPNSLINNVNGVLSGYGTNNPALNINFTASDANIVNWSLSLYDSSFGVLQNWIGNSNNISTVETYNVAVNGTYYANLTVRDNASNVNTSSFTFYVDQTSPQINSLTFNTVSGNNATISVNASDAYSEINNCTYSGAGNGSLVLNGGVYSANLSNLSVNTTYTVNVICYDKTGFLINSSNTFTTTGGFIAQSAVNLGTAGNFVILSKTGVSTTGVTSVVGDMGVSPIAASGITGFSLIADSSNQFSRSSLVTGNIYAADYSPPTPSKMTTAVSDMQTAYTDASSRAASVTELGAGNIGGLTIAPGVYTWGTGVLISTDVTLSGNSSDVWIFQIAQTLDISSGKKVILSGGAQAKNVFWQVAGQTTLGTTSEFSGNILDQTAIVFNNGATLNGRALAQTAVTLIANSVSLPIPVSQIPPTTIVLNPGYAWNNTNFNISLNATGFNGTSISYLVYTLNNTLTNVSISGNITGSSGTVFMNTSGNYSLVYYSVDTLGNIESSKTVYVLLDKTPPTISSFTLSDSSVFTGQTITGSCSASDSISTVSTSITGINTATTGEKTATCTATDSAGNSVASTASYTVTHRSSGGGGSSSSSRLDDTQSTSFSTMLKGESMNIEFNKKDLSLTNIEIKLKEIAKNVKITATQLKGKPASVSSPPVNKLYGYFQIDHVNLNNSIIESLKITFKVTKTWITSNGVNINEVKLFRYDQGWETLETNMLSSDSTYYYFEAKSPGLSYFAIGTVETETTTPSTPATTTPTTSASNTQTTQVEETNNVDASPAENQITGQVIGQTGYKPSWWMASLVMIGVIGLVIGAYFMFRDPKQKNRR